MKIRMLCNGAKSLGCTLKEREEGDVHEAEGEMLVRLGIAVALSPEIKAVEPEATAEVAKPKVKPFGRDKNLQNRLGLPQEAESQPSTVEK